MMFERGSVLAVLKRAQTASRAARFELVRLAEVDPKQAAGWLEKAAVLDRQGKWDESAQIFWSLFSKTEVPEDKFEFGTALVQMFVNVGDYDKAGEWLKKMEGSSERITDELGKTRARGEILLKRAWVADVQDRVGEARELLDKARQLGELIPQAKKEKEDEERASTIVHFSGRANCKLGRRENDPVQKDEYLEVAKKWFETDLARYEKLQEGGDYRPHGLAYNLGWLGEVAMARGDLDEAGELIEKSQGHFEAEVKKAGSRRIMHHYHKLMGRLALEREQPVEAAEQAQAGIEILLSEEGVVYKHGLYGLMEILVNASVLEERMKVK